MPNRLADAQSPYLLQHQDNPVDWYPWGEEAFAEARRRDVPLLISVGYAACHWCHVMAHESFEDEAVAAVMNERFVNVKVDREEHPDVDAVYMAATQGTTGRGGWPMTVFATPDGTPFFCGTYFPPRPVPGMPSFPQVLDAVHQAWTGDREGVLSSAQALGDALADAARRSAAPGTAQIDEDVARAAVERMAGELDRVHGGFGGAPKFPPSTTLAWLLRHHGRTGDRRALELVEATCEAMARGGMYDQLAGGFARYSVDAAWVVPHFEKMLYDNAQLLGVYADLYRATGSPLGARVARETAAWLLTELRTAEGALASSLDADSEGGEGAFYVWTPAELVGVLGEEDGRWAAELWGVTETGTFEHGTSVLQLRTDPDDADRYARVRREVLAARAGRPRPARDDKVVVAWNAMAAKELARAGELLEEPTWLEAAEEIVDAVLATHPTADGRLVRTSRQGRPGPSPAVLEDYAHLADALLTLYQLTGRERHVRRAEELLETVLAEFVADEGVFDTARSDTDPAVARLGRPAEAADGPTPAGTAAAASALLSYAALTGSLRHREAAARCLAAPLDLAGQYPRAVGAALAVAEAWLDGPREVAVVGDPENVQTAALRQVAVAATAPGLVLAVGAPGEAPVGLLADRGLVDDQPAAYVCRQLACRLPTTDPEELAAQLR